MVRKHIPDIKRVTIFLEEKKTIKYYSTMYFIENIKRKMKLDLSGGVNTWDGRLTPLLPVHSWLDLESGAQAKG